MSAPNLPATPRVAALVPMRHESERVPGKNYRPFVGAPLYHRILDTLLAVPAIQTVAIDTDSPVILDDAARRFPSVRLIERPAHLRAGTVPMNDVLLHDIELVPADVFIQTHSTNPLLSPDTIAMGLRRFLTSFPEHDSLFTVTRLQARLWDERGRAMNHDPAVLLRTQDLAPVFIENSCLYIFTPHTLRARRNRIGLRPQTFEVDRQEAWDIDEEADFAIAEVLWSRTQRSSGTES